MRSRLVQKCSLNGGALTLFTLGEGCRVHAYEEVHRRAVLTRRLQPVRPLGPGPPLPDPEQGPAEADPGWWTLPGEPGE